MPLTSPDGASACAGDGATTATGLLASGCRPVEPEPAAAARPASLPRLTSAKPVIPTTTPRATRPPTTIRPHRIGRIRPDRPQGDRCRPGAGSGSDRAASGTECGPVREPVARGASAPYLPGRPLLPGGPLPPTALPRRLRPPTR